jgi:hypothetical protein
MSDLLVTCCFRWNSDLLTDLMVACFRRNSDLLSDLLVTCFFEELRLNVLFTGNLLF